MRFPSRLRAIVPHYAPKEKLYTPFDLVYHGYNKHKSCLIPL